MTSKKKASVKNDMRYVRYVVSMYLRGKPELEEFREDLNQEGMMGLLLGRDKFDPKYGMDRDLYLSYRIKQSIQNYVNRSEVKHFSKPKSIESTQEESSYWDLNESVVSLEELEDTYSIPIDSDKLHEFTDAITMTVREQEALDAYLKTGSYVEVGKLMRISRERARQLVNSVINKCKETLDED